MAPVLRIFLVDKKDFRWRQNLCLIHRNDSILLFPIVKNFRNRWTVLGHYPNIGFDKSTNHVTIDQCRRALLTVPGSKPDGRSNGLSDFDNENWDFLISFLDRSNRQFGEGKFPEIFAPMIFYILFWYICWFPILAAHQSGRYHKIDAKNKGWVLGSKNPNNHKVL